VVRNPECAEDQPASDQALPQQVRIGVGRAVAGPALARVAAQANKIKEKQGPRLG
jgi:hypothetical protein